MRIVLTNIGKSEINNSKYRSSSNILHISRTQTENPQTQSNPSEGKKILFESKRQKSFNLKQYPNEISFKDLNNHNNNQILSTDRINNSRNIGKKINLPNFRKSHNLKSVSNFPNLTTNNEQIEKNNKINSLKLITKPKIKLIELKTKKYDFTKEDVEKYLEEEENNTKDIIQTEKPIFDFKKNSSNKFFNYKQSSDINNNNYKKESINLPYITQKSVLSLKDLLNTRNREKIRDDNILEKEINKKEKSLIHYLSSEKNIQPSFVNKISKANEEKLLKFDKICQKYFYNEHLNKNLTKQRMNKIKNEYSKDFEFCDVGLRNMNRNLNAFLNVCQDLEVKKENLKEKKKYFFDHQKYLMEKEQNIQNEKKNK